MDIPNKELPVGAMLWDTNIDVMLLERAKPTVYGSSYGYWLISEGRVLVWERPRGYFGAIRIYSVEMAIDDVLTRRKMGFYVGRVSEEWNQLMNEYGHSPLRSHEGP